MAEKVDNPKAHGEGWVVGIGASAGGLEALSQFVSHLPKDFAGTIVIAQHLAPHSKSMLVELLSRQTSLPIVSAQDRQRIEPGTIFVVPPNYDIDLVAGRIHLTVAGSETRPKPSVDSFFTSLARAYGDRAVGVVLSGTGTDGSEGIRAIKAVGGITLAQDDRTAKYDGMPKSAVDTGSVDSILPPEEIAKTLIQIFAGHEESIQARELNTEGIQTIFDLIRERTGSDFSKYKPSTILRRTAKRMIDRGSRTLEDYIDLLRVTPGEVQELTRELLINVTSFFRDAEVFEDLTTRLEEMVDRRNNGQELRIWVAGCATGEEAYSIAMILVDLLDRKGKTLQAKVFATDLDHDAILEARSGVYAEKDVEAIPPFYRNQFITQRETGRYEIVKRVRDVCVFAKQDLIQNPPFVKLDLITCRNVMIYFEPELQTRVLETFHYALTSGGMLLLGKSESTSAASSLFETIDRKTKFYMKLNVPSKIISPGRIPQAAPIADMDLQRRRLDQGPSLAEVAQLRLLRAYGISGVVVDEEASIVQIIGDVTQFIGFHNSLADLRLTNLLPKGVGIEIPILIRKAERDNTVHQSRTHRVEKKNETIDFVIFVRPLSEKPASQTGKALYLVNFELREGREPLVTAPAPAAGSEPASNDYHARLSELEHELMITREHLQTVIEELGVSNEELQSLNEELSSTNEELQASNEELETTNEELQSGNEELTTLNEELAIKSGELRVANTSLENTHNSIGSPMVVVDTNMRVLRYNNEATKIFALNQSDIGRDITRISATCEMPDFEEQIELAIRKGERGEGICESTTAVYQMRILPSRDEAKNIIGAILVFFDNTDLIRTKERLTTSELRIRSILDSSPAFFCLKDTLGRYLIVNAEFRRIFGVTDEQVIGKTDREIFSDALAAQFRDSDLEVFLRRSPMRRDEKIKTSDGRDHTYLISRFPLVERAGASPYAVGTVAFEITSQVETQKALQESEARYRAIAEDQAVFICRHSLDLKLTYVNAIYAAYFGGTADSYTGRAFDALISEPDRVAIVDKIKSISIDRPVVQYEYRVRRLGGDERWVRWIHRGIFDGNGRITDYQAVGFDVTDYRQATDQLLQKEAIFTGIFNNTAEFINIFRVTKDGQLVFESLNRAAERSLGYAYAQLIGRPLSDFLDPARREEILARYARVVQTKQPETFDEELSAPGSIKHFSTTIVPILNASGEVERVAALSRDVSGYKHIEMDLRRAKDLAEVANRAKSDFLASMSHELRTPLNVVLGLSQLLEDTTLDKEQKGYVKSIHRSGRVLLALIEDVLDISKIEAGKVRLENVPFSLRDAIEEIHDLFIAQAAEKDLKLSWNIDEQADKTVIGDPGRLRQVLVNFVGNAIKFTDRGSVRILVTREDSGSNLSPSFLFQVADTGIGIRPEDQEKIFQRFSQVQSGNSRKYGGTGLGLVISRHLVELMGGETGFESEADKGSTFWFRVSLPITSRSESRRTKPLDAAGENARAKTEDRSRLTLLDGEKFRVLAVDDNRDSQNVIALLLRRMGHTTKTADSGADAIRLIQENEFDVVLMDVQMPQMDGYETTGRIRKLDGDRAKVPIIALTANALAGDAEKCLQAGMDAYLTKPVRIEALREAILKWAKNSPYSVSDSDSENTPKKGDADEGNVH